MQVKMRGVGRRVGGSCFFFLGGFFSNWAILEERDCFEPVYGVWMEGWVRLR